MPVDRNTSFCNEFCVSDVFISKGITNRCGVTCSFIPGHYWLLSPLCQTAGNFWETFAFPTAWDVVLCVPHSYARGSAWAITADCGKKT